MKARVQITKSFDVGQTYTKEYKQKDFEGFFKDEGEYMDRLAKELEEHGKTGDNFAITYVVSVEKE